MYQSVMDNTTLQTGISGDCGSNHSYVWWRDNPFAPGLPYQHIPELPVYVPVPYPVPVYVPVMPFTFPAPEQFTPDEVDELKKLVKKPRRKKRKAAQ